MDDEAKRQAIEKHDVLTSGSPAGAGRTNRPASGGNLQPQPPESVQTKAYPHLEHSFENQFIDEAATASADRIPFTLLLEERQLLARFSFIASADASAKPVLFFNEHRQLVHANPASIAILRADTLEDALGLRFGELLGCDHKMSDLPNEHHYTCQNCNCMPSMLAALTGMTGKETRKLVMQPFSDMDKAVYDISCIPVSASDKRFAMMTLDPVQDSPFS